MRVTIDTYEAYPVHSVMTEQEGRERGEDRVFDVPDDTVTRWRQVMAEYAAVQHEMDLLTNPRCPECGHPQIRHQEWSEGWDTWGCLDRVPVEGGGEFDTRTCRCQHGKPEGR